MHSTRRPVRRYYGEKRAGADVVVVEGEPGAAIVVAAWMLDPAACAGMEIGAPHVSVEALVDSSMAVAVVSAVGSRGGAR